MATLTEKETLTVRTVINAPAERAWQLWTDPKHIVHWNNASDDWHTPRAENDLRVGGKFMSRMEAWDGSMGFDFTGEYSKIEPPTLIECTLDDDRTVQIRFISDGNTTTVIETFETEQENSIELQQRGWQSILDNFKKHVEAYEHFKALHFEVNIHAKPEKVYEIMLNEKTYTEWTSEFNPTSHFEGSWEKGSKIMFLGTDHDGKLGGMFSRIKENIPNKYISIEHLGIVNEAKEIISAPEKDSWSGALENYTFTEINNNTLLSVDLDAKNEFLSYFEGTWPKALKTLKEICEK